MKKTVAITFIANAFSMFLIFGVATLQAEEDFLLEDDFDMGEVEGLQGDESSENWKDGFVSILEHSQTQIEEGRQYQRSSARLQYEYAIADGWFLSLAHKLSYYWQDDQQAQQQDEAYSRSRWQQAWVQYSKGSCAYKVGKQNLIWGNVEGTFAVDVVTPFDYTEQLLTDYNSVRLAQTMVLSECFLPAVQTQLFYIPESRLDLTSHRAQPYEHDGDAEFGGRVKINWQGGDVSFMAARLQPNQPTYKVEPFSLPEWHSEAFSFYGASSSIAISRLLLKLDLGFKQGQTHTFTAEEYDALEVAAGFEYTTSSNHNFNAGWWVIKELAHEEQASQSPLYTFGWSKTYLNDDLSMSVLSNITTDPETYGGTVLAQYQWDDYWQFSAALSLSEVKDNSTLAVLPPEEALTLQAKVQF